MNSGLNARVSPSIGTLYVVAPPLLFPDGVLPRYVPVLRDTFASKYVSVKWEHSIAESSPQALLPLCDPISPWHLAIRKTPSNTAESAMDKPVLLRWDHIWHIHLTFCTIRSKELAEIICMSLKVIEGLTKPLALFRIESPPRILFIILSNSSSGFSATSPANSAKQSLFFSRTVF